MIHKLPVAQVVAAAFALPWARRDAFVRALALPALVIVAIEVAWWLASDRIDAVMRWAAWIARGIAWILFAIGCHRVVLLDRPARDVPILPGWGGRETLFLAWMVVICAVVLAVGWIILAVTGAIVANISAPFFAVLVSWLPLVLGIYLFARLALVFPATAIDQRTSLARAWRQTRGNGWRMAVIVGLMPWAFGYAAQLAGGDDPGLVKAIVVTVLATALLAVEISALSLSYRELATPEP